MSSPNHSGETAAGKCTGENAQPDQSVGRV
jgi:hypothetical protein